MDVEGRLWIVVAICAVVAGLGLSWLGTHPEPCTDRTVTVCASAPRSAP